MRSRGASSAVRPSSLREGPRATRSRRGQPNVWRSGAATAARTIYSSGSSVLTRVARSSTTTTSVRTSTSSRLQAARRSITPCATRSGPSSPTRSSLPRPRRATSTCSTVPSPRRSASRRPCRTRGGSRQRTSSGMGGPFPGDRSCGSPSHQRQTTRRCSPSLAASIPFAPMSGRATRAAASGGTAPRATSPSASEATSVRATSSRGSRPGRGSPDSSAIGDRGSPNPCHLSGCTNITSPSPACGSHSRKEAHDDRQPEVPRSLAAVPEHPVPPW